MLFLIVGYYIGLGVGISLIIFISYLYKKKIQKETQANIDELIFQDKIKQLYTYYDS